MINLSKELSTEECIELLQHELDEQKEIFDMAEMADDLSGMSISFNKISEIEHLLLHLYERLNRLNGSSDNMMNHTGQLK